MRQIAVEIRDLQSRERALKQKTEAPASKAAEATPEFLQLTHFKPHVGKIFRFKGTRYAFPLDHILSDRKKLPAWVKRRPFTLIFRGPNQQDVLPEGLYECEIDGGPTYTLYVAPIFTPQLDRQDYQAVFN
jgi:hypothetical protein